MEQVVDTGAAHYHNFGPAATVVGFPMVLSEFLSRLNGYNVLCFMFPIHVGVGIIPYIRYDTISVCLVICYYYMLIVFSPYSLQDETGRVNNRL